MLRTAASGARKLRRRRLIGLVGALALAVSWPLLVAVNPFVSATSGGDPYSVPLVVDTNPAPNIVETTIIADEATVDIGNGVMAHAQTFNGQIPGPTFDLNVGDTVIVHFQNHLQRRPASTGTASSSRTRWTARRSPRTRSRRGAPSSTIQGHPAGNLLVPPAPPLLDQPGVQGPVRDDHRHGPERGGRCRQRGSCPRRARPSRSSSATPRLQAPGTQRRATYNPALPAWSGGALPAQAQPTPSLCEAPTSLPDAIPDRRRRQPRAARSQPATSRTSRPTATPAGPTRARPSSPTA